MDNAARTRQRVLAIFLPVTAVLYISAEALSPKGTDQVITTTATALKVLPIAARHPAQLYVAGSLALLGLGGLAVSYAAIAALVRNRGAAVATVAALIGGLGAFRGAIINVLVYPNLAAAATAHLTPGAAARFLVTTFNSGFGHVFLYAYFIGEYAAPSSWGMRCGVAGASRTGWRPCSSSACMPLNFSPRAGPSSSCTCCHSRPRWSCWRPGSGRQLLSQPASRDWSRPVYPCSSILRRPGQSQKGRSKPRGSLWPGFLVRLGSQPVRFAPSSPAGPAAWHPSPTKYRRR